MITKTESLKKSERVFALVCDEIAESANNDNYNICGYLDPFNNCRETGLYLTAYYYEDIKSHKSVYSDIFVWVYEHRNGDGICVIVSKERPDVNGKFNEKAWECTKCFDWDGEHGAADYIIDTLVDMYEAELKKESK